MTRLMRTEEMETLPVIARAATFEALERAGQVDRACGLAIAWSVLAQGDKLTVDNFVSVLSRLVQIATVKGITVT